MGVIRRDMFGDGLCMYDYYTHKRIELYIGGFKIVISKPYNTQVYRDYVLSEPSIVISSNARVYTDMKELSIINTAINRAIDMLNAENDGLFIDKNFAVNTDKYVHKDAVPDFVKDLNKKSKEGNSKYMRKADLNARTIYETEKGRKFMYLGHGDLILVEIGPYSRKNRKNRSGCSEIYLDVDILNMNKWEVRGDTIVVTEASNVILVIDTQSTLKKFVKEVRKFDVDIKHVLIPGYNEEYHIKLGKSRNTLWT